MMAGPQVILFCLTWFHYNIDKMPWELNFCLYQLPHGKICFVVFTLLTVTESTDEAKWGLTNQTRI